MKRLFAVLTIFLTIAACAAPVVSTKRVQVTDEQVSQIKQTVSYGLKDPASAMFRDIKAGEQTRQDGSVTTYVCGQVNAKNSFGAYVGYTYFNGWLTNGKFQMISLAQPNQNFVYAAQCNF